MFKWLRTNWGKRQMGAMADLVQATREISPDWKEIQISRKSDGVVFSIVTDSTTTVHNLHETE